MNRDNFRIYWRCRSMLEGYLQNLLQLSPNKFLISDSVHNPYRTVASYFIIAKEDGAKKFKLQNVRKTIVTKVWIDMYHFMTDIKKPNKKCFPTAYLTYHTSLRVSTCPNFKAISLSSLCREAISLVSNCKENLTT